MTTPECAHRPEQEPKVPCPEGFYWIGQPMTHCDQCGFPAWEHEGWAEFRPSSPFDMNAPAVLRPWNPGEREACRSRWEDASAAHFPPRTVPDGEDQV